VKLVLAFLLSLISFPVMAATGISVDSLVNALIFLVIVGLILWVAWWFIGYIALPEPFAKVARVILALLAFVILINFLLGFLGHPLVRFS